METNEIALKRCPCPNKRESVYETIAIPDYQQCLDCGRTAYPTETDISGLPKIYQDLSIEDDTLVWVPPFQQTDKFQIMLDIVDDKTQWVYLPLDNQGDGMKKPVWDRAVRFDFLEFSKLFAHAFATTDSHD